MTTTAALSDATVLWRFISGRHEAYCLLQPHPIGQELRYIFDGVQLIGVVSADREELNQRALQWRLRLMTDGWAEVEPRLQPVRTRTASVRPM